MRARCRSQRTMITGLASVAALALTMLSAPAALAAHAPGQARHLAAAPEPTGTFGPHALPAGDRLACPAAARPGQAECASVLRRPAASSASSVPGYGPVSLRGAYNLTAAASRDGRGSIVAIVEAYQDPAATADLAVYRSHFRLPACTRASGCLRITNEHGGTAKLPAPNAAWATDQSIGLDVVSALCPRCRLLLVEASSNSLTDLGTAEDTAVAKGARFVFNGWDGIEFLGQGAFARYFNHPGAAIVFGAGDTGYGTSFPADLQYVTAVGGTTLNRSKFNARHWAETAWTGTNSGCSILEAKPSWQRADASASAGCLNRTENDVAADADPGTGAAIYDSFGTSKSWAEDGGTALAAAIITAAYALAGAPAPHSYPASYPYQHAGHLYDVRFGSNGACGLTREYLCTAGVGYDGPTGLGTPHGTAAFSAAGTHPVTLVDPGTQDDQAGTSVSFRITGLDARKAATALRYTARGLPAGLSIRSVPHSTSAEISGRLPAAVGSHAVTVTARDTKTGQTGTTRFSIVAAGSLTPAAPITSAIATDTNISLAPPEGLCLDSGAGTAGTQATIQACTGTAQQLWTYLPEGAPGAPYQLTINGLCLSLAAGSVQLGGCDRGVTTQGWRLLFGGTLENAGAGRCLETGSNFTNPLTLQPCNTALGFQQWHLITATLQSAVPGMCMAVNDDGFHPAPYTVEPCGNGGQQGFGFNNDGRVLSSLLRCMGEGNAGVESANCSGSVAQDWLVGPGGELINESSGLCLDDQANSQVAGTQLVLDPCYGTLGEIWAIA